MCLDHSWAATRSWPYMYNRGRGVKILRKSRAEVSKKAKFANGLLSEAGNRKPRELHQSTQNLRRESQIMAESPTRSRESGLLMVVMLAKQVVEIQMVTTLLVSRYKDAREHARKQSEPQVASRHRDTGRIPKVAEVFRVSDLQRPTSMDFRNCNQARGNAKLIRGRTGCSTTLEKQALLHCGQQVACWASISFQGIT
ncbi:hypothetical protein OG21DRAFT_892485 [Imleria badia]|nr:hypothetical protein OG21DRAFT_892485 [Imleria badia]